MSADRVRDTPEQQGQLLTKRGKRIPGKQRRRGIQLQVEAIQLEGDPGVGGCSADRLVLQQWPRLTVDQEQLEFGTDHDRADSETRPFEQLAERQQALLESLLKPRVVGFIECIPVDPLPHRRSLTPTRA